MQKNYRLLEAIHGKFDTQKIFAQRMGLSTSIVSDVVNGKRNLDDSHKAMWADMLSRAVTELFPASINA